MKKAYSVCGIAALAMGVLVVSASIARAQVLIKVNDDVNFKLGVLGQFQVDTIKDNGTDVTASNLFVRRLRLLFGGQVAKSVTFFVETDTPNLGKTLATGKNITPATIIQDAYGEFKPSNGFSVDAGLMFVPFTRNSTQSGATLLPIDYGAYTFSQSAPTQSSTGRDTGFQAKGNFVKNRLEYRIGAFQGLRNARSNNALRYAGRLQYNVLDPETGFFYAGTYVGAKKILAIGAAFDTQSHYHAYDADVFTEYPFGPGAFNGQLDLTHFDGDVTLATLPKQTMCSWRSGIWCAQSRSRPCCSSCTAMWSISRQHRTRRGRPSAQTTGGRRTTPASRRPTSTSTPRAVRRSTSSPSSSSSFTTDALLQLGRPSRVHARPHAKGRGERKELLGCTHVIRSYT